MTNYYVMISQKRYPEVPITSNSDALRHLSASLGQPLRGIVNTTSFASPLTQYAQAGPILASAVYGIDCESFASKEGQFMEHGMNNQQGTPLTLIGSFDAAPAGGATRIQQTYVNMDAVLTFDMATSDVSISY
jgi:hypothetical protein